MKPLNLRVILLLGGILVITLGFQIFQRITVENFETAAAATPAAAATAAATAAAEKAAAEKAAAEKAAAEKAAAALNVGTVLPLGAETLTGTGLSVYNIPIGNGQNMRLSLPAQSPTVVTTPVGPLPSSSPPIR